MIVEDMDRMYGIFQVLFPNIDGLYKYIYFLKRWFWNRCAGLIQIHTVAHLFYYVRILIYHFHRIYDCRKNFVRLIYFILTTIKNMTKWYISTLKRNMEKENGGLDFRLKKIDETITFFRKNKTWFNEWKT